MAADDIETSQVAMEVVTLNAPPILEVSQVAIEVVTGPVPTNSGQWSVSIGREHD